MPEQTRADVEKSFEVLASRYGGKVLFMMNQGDFKEYWDKDAKGKCHGISILWLRHQHSELQSRAFAFFDEKKKRMVQLLEIRYRELKGRHDKLWARAQEYFAASQKDRFDKFSDEEQELFRLPAQYNDERDRRDHILAADPLARVLHEKMHREAQQRSGLVIKPKQERERLNDLFRQWDMHYESSKVFAGGWLRGHTDLGKFVAKAKTASLIHSKVHTMAACNTLGKPRFFDPNWGAVEFSNGANLGSFLSAFFKIPIINREYGQNKDYKKLELQADRYYYEVNRVYTIR